MIDGNKLTIETRNKQNSNFFLFSFVFADFGLCEMGQCWNECRTNYDDESTSNPFSVSGRRHALNNDTNKRERKEKHNQRKNHSPRLNYWT